MLLADTAPAQTLDVRIEARDAVATAVSLAEESVEAASRLDQDRQVDLTAWLGSSGASVVSLSDVPLEALPDLARVEDLDIVLDTLVVEGEPPPELEAPLGPFIASIEEEATATDVILDILLDTIGIGNAVRDDVANALREMLGEPENAEALEDLIAAIEGNDWSGVSPPARRLLRQLLGPFGRRRLRQLLHRRVYLRLAAALGGRAVPLLGQALILGSFLISLWQNRDAIIELIPR